MPRAVFFNSRDIVAIIDDAPGGGHASDPAALRNRPAVDPASWLDHVHFNSLLDYYQLLDSVQSVTIGHTSLAGISTVVFSTYGLSVTVDGQQRYLDILLYAHGKGYAPPYMISYAGARLPAGTCIQLQVSGSFPRSRTVSHFANSTGIYLREHAASSDVALDAVSLDYKVMIFDRTAGDPSKKLAAYKNSTGLVQLGHERIRSDQKYLRRDLPAESVFDININGPTMDIAGGRVRAVTGGVSYDDPGYAGGFTGPAYVPVSGVF